MEIANRLDVEHIWNSIVHGYRTGDFDPMLQYLDKQNYIRRLTELDFRRQCGLMSSGLEPNDMDISLHRRGALFPPCKINCPCRTADIGYGPDKRVSMKKSPFFMGCHIQSVRDFLCQIGKDCFLQRDDFGEQLNWGYGYLCHFEYMRTHDKCLRGGVLDFESICPECKNAIPEKYHILAYFGRIYLDSAPDYCEGDCDGCIVTPIFPPEYDD